MAEDVKPWLARGFKRDGKRTVEYYNNDVKAIDAAYAMLGKGAKECIFAEVCDQDGRCIWAHEFRP